MEEHFYHSDFEDLIKENADQYKMYPSDRVWKNVDRSLRSRRKWYWSGFVVLLSGISYFAVTELMSPPANRMPVQTASAETAHVVNTRELIPFTSDVERIAELRASKEDSAPVLSGVTLEDSGDITASFEIPLRFLNLAYLSTGETKASLRITGLEPLGKNEEYNIEVSWPVSEPSWLTASALQKELTEDEVLEPENITAPSAVKRINWLQDQITLDRPAARNRKIKWQLAFSPTINYRKLTGGKAARISPTSRTIPLALRVEGDVNNLVNHRPALGFELGTHGMMELSKNLTFKGGIQFNYSKYDISAFRTPSQMATIALNSTTGFNGGSLVSYTDFGNFGGTSVEVLKNQYYQLSVPIGFELKLFGNDKLALNVASTIQPTYLLNKNTYLITTDYKNYTKEPSLVRRWNVNAGAEAFISYKRGDVQWQVGPQFRYQLLSSYENVYPIKEYLMEYGIKIGITKTIR